MKITDIINIDTVLGKIAIIILIIIAVYYHLLLGVAVVLIFISIDEDIFEGMESMDSSKESSSQESPSQESPQDKFRKSNCQGQTLVKDDKTVTPDLIKDSFPNIKFDGDECNPCDVDCKFEIIDSNERLANESKLRGEDSNNIPVDRESVTKKQEQ
jgi:hypothetical protein|tara:strand:+ start:768 stop:1238 length:471 start_codon:yes stop_codon:yes gene_type:complete